MHASLKFLTVAIVTVAIHAAWSRTSNPLRASDEIPGTVEKTAVALVGGTVHPVDGPPIENGIVVFENGEITTVGARKDHPVPAGAREIDVTGKQVYPALIAASSQLGLIEIGAVRATNDRSEIGSWNPSVRAEVSVNPDSELIPVARAGGVGYALSEPTGGVISGTSALIRLDGWTWESMTFEAPIAVHVRWPRMATSSRRSRGGDGASRRDERLATLDRMFQSAKVPAAEGEVRDLSLEALAPFARGERPVFLHASDPRDIRAAVRWAKSRDLDATIVGARRAAEVASFLAAEEVPVIYGPVHRLPSRRDHAFDEPFTGPGRLAEAGVNVAICGFETDNARNLPHHAATACAHGLEESAALRSITLTPAEILGVADRLGSITVGKRASLIVCDGDILEITTSVERMWLEGRPVEMTSKQTRLYEKYKRR